jgi:tetratricopeptide (TPR) repeat protein
VIVFESKLLSSWCFLMHLPGQLTVWISLGVLCVGATLSVQTKSADRNGSDLQAQYDDAQRSQASGDLNRADEEYRAFLANAQGELAAEHAAAGDYARATSLFKEALSLLPDSPALLLGYAKTELLMGDPSRAETLAEAFLRQGSGDSHWLAQAHQILGRALLKMNRDQDARDEMQKAVDLDPNFANRYNLAVVCLDLDDEKCATQTFQGLEQTFGDTSAIHMRFGLAYGNSDFVPQTIAEFRKVIAESPRFPGAHYALAAALLSAGNDAKNVPEAEVELKKELTLSPNDFLTYAALGKLAVTHQRYAEATRYLQRATALNPSNPDAFLYLGQMYFDTNRFAEAQTALRKAIALTKDPSRNRYQIQKAHFLLGRILAETHQPEAAHAEMKIAQALTDKGLSHDRSELAGLLNHSAAPETDDAPSSSESAPPSVSENVDRAAIKTVAAFEKRLTPAIADSYNNLGAAAATGKNYADALRYFEDAAIWNPTLEGLDLNRGRAAFMASRFSDATPPLARYVHLHPQDAGIRSALAISQFMTSDYRGCVNTLKDADQSIASIPQVQYVYAESLVKTGQVLSGKARLESLEAAHPEIADVHRGLGEALELEGDREKAIQELRSAITLDANDADAHYHLGKIELDSGDASAAIPELESAIKLLPSDPKFHRELAGAYKVALRPADAEKELRVYDALRASQEQPIKSAADSRETKARDR